MPPASASSGAKTSRRNGANFFECGRECMCVCVCVCKKVSEKRVGGESENARGFE